ncbi:hypothetical protein GW17_00000423 [Ensete ventricosum]|nr:hypothetical protein GW17_00000423 [Ensete ventricosum]RZR79422.1 hypothetical protein BHM03_00005139 [Ensete ventricosum]
MQVPFGYTRKDVLLIGLGVTLAGIGLKSGLEVMLFLQLSFSQGLQFRPVPPGTGGTYRSARLPRRPRPPAVAARGSPACGRFFSRARRRSVSPREETDRGDFAGVDPLQAGNVVQLFIVLGLTVGWISTYMFRVANKDMTYAQQLRDYEKKVMEKRLEGLTEAELEALLEQVEEEKRRLATGEQIN